MYHDLMQFAIWGYSIPLEKNCEFATRRQFNEVADRFNLPIYFLMAETIPQSGYLRSDNHIEFFDRKCGVADMADFLMK